MLSISNKLQIIESFKTAYFDHGLDFISNSKDGFPDKIEFDRWLALDICRVLNDYRKELIKNASNQS